MTLTALLEENIKKLTSALKDEETLREILKKRLTKKEFKILMYMCDDVTTQQQMEKLSLSEKRYEEVKTKALKKVNFHDLKEELMQKEGTDHPTNADI